MAHAKRTPPEFPIEAYQFAETQHLGTPLNMYRAHTTDGLGCFLAILGSILALIPLAGFLSDDDDYTFSKFLHVMGYCVGAFLTPRMRPCAGC